MSVFDSDSILRMELITTQERELDAQNPDQMFVVGDDGKVIPHAPD